MYHVFFHAETLLALRAMGAELCTAATKLLQTLALAVSSTIDSPGESSDARTSFHVMAVGNRDVHAQYGRHDLRKIEQRFKISRYHMKPFAQLVQHLRMHVLPINRHCHPIAIT